MSKLPLVETIGNLQGFEFATFWVSAIVVYFAAGYFIDMLLNKMGMGPYWNSAFALVGGYGGLYVRQIYFPAKYLNFEPYVTAGFVLTGVVLVVLAATQIRLRL